MRGAIHQFLPSFAGRDAIGRHTLAAQRLLREHGFESDIFAGESRREVARSASDYQRFRPVPGQPTWLLYQCSTGSPVGEYCRARPEPMIIDYHNITPAEMFDAWEPHVAVELVAGRTQLARLAPESVFGMADSTYNETELRHLGCARTAVAPILLDLDEFHEPPDRAAVAKLQAEKDRGGADWLFVGRLAPNKAQHQIVAAFAAYVRHVDGSARLHLVGGSSSHRYETAMRAYVAELGLGDRVRITTSVPHGELLAHYAVADVFVCLSDHEGFCVPIVEAMELGVPVVAYAAGAVPETLGSGGLLLPGKEPTLVASAVERVVTDTVLRASLIAAGRRRAEQLSFSHTSRAFLDAIESAVSG